LAKIGGAALAPSLIVNPETRCSHRGEHCNGLLYADALGISGSQVPDRKEEKILLQQKLKMNTLVKLNPFRGSSLWDPIREMEDMQNRAASVLGRRVALRKEEDEEGFTLTEWLPPVDIAEDEKEYTLKVELPGVKREDVRVSVEGGVLSLTGERKVEKEEKNKKHHRMERIYGSFVRTFTLPEGAAPDKISAEFKDGVLIVHLPKDEKAKPKSIEVKVS
jgi:HSP20 family protein